MELSNLLVAAIAIARCIVAGIACYLAYSLAIENKDGWGWMVFIAFAAIPPTITTGS